MRINHPVPSLFGFALAVVTSGCDVAYETLPDRAATKMGTRIAGGGHSFGVCSGLDTRGIGRRVDPAPAGEVLAGYDNSVQHGASCHLQVSFGFTGAFRFDLDDLRGRIISSAVIRMGQRITNVPPSIGGDFRGTCRLALEFATIDWLPGESRVTARIGDIRSLPLPGRHESLRTTWIFVPEVTGAEVTGIVQQWALGRRPNFGFVLKRPPGSIERDDNSDTCTNYWTPTLSVTALRPS
jgi:hypothetical protein